MTSRAPRPLQMTSLVSALELAAAVALLLGPASGYAEQATVSPPRDAPAANELELPYG